MNNIHTQLEARLSKTFRILLQHGMEHATCNNGTDVDAIQAVSCIQGALELLCKLFQLNKLGWKAIIDERHHDDSEDLIIKAINDMSIRTVKQEDSERYIIKCLNLSNDDCVLLRKFRSHRNQIMHLGISGDITGALSDSIILTVRVITRLNWNDATCEKREYGVNTLEDLIGKEIAGRLLQKSVYSNEAVDLAYERYDDEMYFCPECGNESWCENEDSDLLCHACGFKQSRHGIEFTDCISCKRIESAVYDNLNISSSNPVIAKCGPCRFKFMITKCKSCGEIFTSMPGNCHCDNDGKMDA